MNATDDPEPTSSANTNEKPMPFSCSICEKKFSNEKGYFGHLRIHSGEVLWSCKKCPPSEVTFDSQSKLQTHENLCHTLVRPHKCSDCNDVFDRASQLDYHRRSYHLGEKSQVCQICEKAFFRKNDLQTHLNVHLGTNQSICEICGKKFNHVSNLIRHSRSHSGSKPYPCSICEKRFTQISSLARHKRIHLRETNPSFSDKQEDKLSTNEDNSKVVQKKIVKRRHYCRVCGESFQFMVLLRQHERLHSKTTENLAVKISGKSQDGNSSNDKNDQTEQNNAMLSSADPGESSASNWREFNIQEKSVFENYVETQTEEEPTNSIRDHLLELDRKMNAIEIGSDRDVSISISDILSPYNCDDLELLNADTSAMEQNLYDNSNTDNNDNDLEKEYDIVQCLDDVDFASNIDSQLLDDSPEKIASQDSSDRPKGLSKDSRASKFKSLSSLTKDQYNKCLQIEGSQLYIEICESEYLKSSRSHALELQEIENVALFQEVFEPLEDDVLKCSRENIEKIATDKSSKNIDNIEDRVYNAGVSADTEEPTLRLVQTETGEQFYEFMIGNQGTDNFENLENTEEDNAESNEQVDIENSSPLLTSGNVCQADKLKRQSEHPDKLINESNCTELFQLLPNTESYKEISAQTDASMPMVRLVQNEDGSQFFELIREPLEYEREDCEIENPCDEKISDISDISDNSNFPNNTNAQIATSSNTAVQRVKKEYTAENLRPAKDRTRKFRCTECNKWFSTAYNFKQHAGMHFSEQQNFQCQHCGLSFAWKSTLNKHLTTNHRADGPQKFVCEICPKVYNKMSQVTEHVKRDHLKERNHMCSNCGKSFFKKFDLKTHMRTHTNERPYVCRACGKTFQHQSHIIRHERVHTGERPYTCDICQRTFTQTSALKNHRQKCCEAKMDSLEYHMDEDEPLSTGCAID